MRLPTHASLCPLPQELEFLGSNDNLPRLADEIVTAGVTQHAQASRIGVLDTRPLLDENPLERSFDDTSIARFRQSKQFPPARLALRNVLHLPHVLHRFAVRVTNQGNVRQSPDDTTILVKIALLHLEVWGIAGNQRRAPGNALRNVVRMVMSPIDFCSSSCSENPNRRANAVLTRRKRCARSVMDHGNIGVFKCATEALFAFA